MWKDLWKKCKETTQQLGSILLDTVLIIGWLLILYFGRLAFDWVVKIFSPEAALDHTEGSVIEIGHHILIWTALISVILYIGSELIKIAIRKWREVRDEYLKPPRDDDES